MSMPARTQPVCSPKNAPADTPQGVPTQENCEEYDVQRTGTSLRWKLRCAGDPPASGSGEMHYPDKDHYSGQMRMKVGADEMQVKMRGKRLGTACDAGQVNKQIAAAQAQSAQHMEEVCRNGVEAMSAYAFTGTAGIDCPARYKDQYCARLKSEAGFDRVAEHGAAGQTAGPYDSGPGAAASVCALPAGDPGAATAPQAPEAPKDPVIKAGKKALRGLIGF